MDKTLFDRLVKETYATYGKPDPRPAVLDAAYKHVADMPDDFIVWASERLQDADRLPPEPRQGASQGALSRLEGCPDAHVHQ